MHIRPPRLAPALALALASAACSASTVPSGGEGALDVDEAAILADLATFRTSPDFTPVNQNTYETALGTGAAINVFVSAGSFDDYASIDAEASGSNASVPEGTLIVREVLEAPGGKVKTLTLMYKGPAGYNPDLADFWFGVTDPDGVVVVENEVRKSGRLQECYGCHLARAQDGYLFGVPGTNRPGVTPPAEPPPAEEPPPPADEPPPPADEPPPPADEPPPPQPDHPVCGDFLCEGDENCASCDYDCGECPDDDDDDHGGGDDHDDDDDDHGGDDDHDDDDHGGDHG